MKFMNYGYSLGEGFIMKRAKPSNAVCMELSSVVLPKLVSQRVQDHVLAGTDWPLWDIIYNLVAFQILGQVLAQTRQWWGD
jgi:hypothetical protein